MGMSDQQLEHTLRQALDAGSHEPDELTRAALRAARYRALEQLEERSWWSIWRRPALAAALLGLSVMLGWQMSQPGPQNTELASASVEDAAVIADLDLVIWLAEGEV